MITGRHESKTLTKHTSCANVNVDLMEKNVIQTSDK